MAIGELKQRLKATFSRRFSSSSHGSNASAEVGWRRALRVSASTRPSRPSTAVGANVVDGEDVSEDVGVGVGVGEADEKEVREVRPSDLQHHQHLHPLPLKPVCHHDQSQKHESISTADFPTPNTDIVPVLETEDEDEGDGEDQHQHHDDHQDENNYKHSKLAADHAERPRLQVNVQHPTEPDHQTSPPPPALPARQESANSSKYSARPEGLSRQQSLLPHQQTRLIKTLLQTELNHAADPDFFANAGPSPISPNMMSRKIWVKRPGASATLVTIHEDDLVDDVRDMILKKYANSLGRNFDAPDVTLRIVPREQRLERTLGPEEPIGRTLDAYYPGGQTVDEALVIDVPLRRTPKASPRPPGHYHYDESRPLEAGSDYFPPMPLPVPSPRLPQAVLASSQVNVHPPPISHAMSVLTTGHVPPLPSPGSSRRHHGSRPRMGRTHTSSPTIIGTHAVQAPNPSNGTQVYNHSLQRLNNGRSRTHSNASVKEIPPPQAPPLPTPPLAVQQLQQDQIQRIATPPPRVSSPRPPKRAKKKTAVDHPNLPAGMLNGAVPPINVLIVEDNIINLKLLEAFMKRLKVRWQTAMNGREAVTKWRGGGFHLVLMDIQLPIMSGLEATKEIRRLERLNSIGVFSSSASSSAPSEKAEEEEPEGDDRLPQAVVFRSPVIIVALTASSLQSDRHEALAAGCNDFLTKPVNFVWLERKVMEWGCMQALIDFDGWRKWKDFSQQSALPESKDKKTKKKIKEKETDSRGGDEGGVGGAGASGAGGLGVHGGGSDAGSEKKRRDRRKSRSSLSSISGVGEMGSRESIAAPGGEA